MILQNIRNLLFEKKDFLVSEDSAMMHHAKLRTFMLPPNAIRSFRKFSEFIGHCQEKVIS